MRMPLLEKSPIKKVASPYAPKRRDSSGAEGPRAAGASSPEHLDLFREEQEEFNCAIHAFNNAMQKRLITKAMVTEYLKTVYANFRMPKLSKTDFIKQESERGFSPDHIIAIARTLGFYFHDLPLDTDLKTLVSGSYFLMGRYPEFSHAIGMSNGYVIESIRAIEKAPYLVTTRASALPRNYELTKLWAIRTSAPARTLQYDEEPDFVFIVDE